jgi:hypothetical protein
MPRNRFLDAMRAEGLPIGQAYGRALYRNPLFWDMRDERGRKPYAKVLCPNVERICSEMQVSMGHTALLSRPLMEAMVAAVARIKKHAAAVAKK